MTPRLSRCPVFTCQSSKIHTIIIASPAGHMYADDTPVEQMREERMVGTESRCRNRRWGGCLCCMLYGASVR